MDGASCTAVQSNACATVRLTMNETKTPLVFSTSELLNADLPPEPPEQAYRRGYSDGWVECLNALDDLLKEGMSYDDALQRCWDHWDGPLDTWKSDEGEHDPAVYSGY